MKRWVRRHRENREVPEIDAFLAEVAEVCRKHGLSIEHEDHHGAFLVREFNESAEEWLMEAPDARKVDP